MASYENSTKDVGYAERAPAAPGTFPGLIARLESLIKKSHAVRDHAENVREKIDGSRHPSDVTKTAQLAPVRSGFISQTDDLLADLERALCGADDALECVWSKVS